MDVSLWLSIVASILSAGSFGFTAYSILRDRGRVLAVSEIFQDNSRSLKPGPSMLIRVVNSGRRPVSLARLVRKCSQGEWSSFLTTPPLKTDDKGVLIEVPRTEEFVAQNTAVRLLEGDVFELIIHHDDFSELYGFFDEEIRTATDLYFEDVLGRRYRVRKAAKNLKILYSYEKSGE